MKEDVVEERRDRIEVEVEVRLVEEKGDGLIVERVRNGIEREEEEGRVVEVAGLKMEGMVEEVIEVGLMRLDEEVEVIDCFN